MTPEQKDMLEQLSSLKGWSIHVSNLSLFARAESLFKQGYVNREIDSGNYGHFLYNINDTGRAALEVKPVKKIKLSPTQQKMLARAKGSGGVIIYEGYRRFIRTAESLKNKGLFSHKFAYCGDGHTSYQLTDAGRAMLEAAQS